MKRLLVLSVMFFLSSSFVMADDLKPPVPMSSGDGSDLLPPPMDLSQLTPLPLPGNMDIPALPDPDKKEATAPAVSADSLSPKTIDSAPAPAKVSVKETLPTATPTREATATPTPLPDVKKETAAPSKGLTGTFIDYFPTQKGAQWTYEYLKADPVSKVKKTRLVQSVLQDQTPAGVLNAVFQTTEDGKTVESKFTLEDNKVARTSEGDKTLSGEFAFQFPVKGILAHWTSQGKTAKASFGKGQVYKKVYPDCVIVTEKNPESTVISYYAKGIGLVAVEVYGKGLKLDQTKSFALVSK